MRKFILSKKAKRNIFLTALIIIILDIIFFIIEYYNGEITLSYIIHRLIFFLSMISCTILLNLVFGDKD
ncbi:MAG TPA: hypothetical protein GX708_17900 [Gallicola sp.]|nr:hypothetical protein [Gallicola sp.]